MGNQRAGFHSGSITVRDALINGPTTDSIIIDNRTCSAAITNGITIKGDMTNFANFDDATSTVCTQTGSAATTWAARIKVITPDGSAGYINVYSTSNA